MKKQRQTWRKSTPWGMADGRREVANGITWYFTPSHGGIHLSGQRATEIKAKAPKLKTFADGRECRWFEEDIDFVFVILAFPECFSMRDCNYARETYQNKRILYVQSRMPGWEHTEEWRRLIAKCKCKEVSTDEPIE